MAVRWHPSLVGTAEPRRTNSFFLRESAGAMLNALYLTAGCGSASRSSMTPR